MPSNHHDHPDCPDCETDVFVEHYTGAEGFVCFDCGLTFDVDDWTPDGRRPTGADR